MHDIWFLNVCSLDAFIFAPACCTPYVTAEGLAVWGDSLSIPRFHATLVYFRPILLENL